jgi:arylsulfatase A-like enzyme
MATERPNILYIFTDQQGANSMSCAGNGDLQTPAMDRLAAEGVRFERTYCAQPLCTPSRSSMFTGLMPHQTGAPRNEMAISEHLRQQEMGTVFAAAGYECAYGGKWHVPGLTIQDGHGFRRISPIGSQRPNLNGGDDHLVEACEAFLRQQHEQPFLLVASFDNPHNICEYANELGLPQGPIPAPPSVEECPALPANSAVPPDEPEAIRFEQSADPFMYPTADYTIDDWRRYRWAYYRLVEKVDAMIGRILDVLDEQGLWENTLVVFSSDHGDGGGAHQWNQKCVLYEESVRVPLIVRGPGSGPKGFADREHLVCNGLDLLPTFCDYAGIKPPAGLSGASLRQLVEGRQPTSWREGVVVETVFDGDCGRATVGRMVRTDRYKYVVYEWGTRREQLFDLEQDPGEMVNLIASTSHANVLEDHRRRLYARCEKTGDRARDWLFAAGAH